MIELSFRQSEFTAFKSCRRNWALNYRLNLERKRQRPGTAGTGTLVHKGLEAYYLGQEWQSAVSGLWYESSGVYEGEDLASYGKQLDLARIILTGYVDWVAETGADAGWTIKSVERQLSVPFGNVAGAHVTVTGKADLEIEDEYGLPKLIDHKTRDSMAGDPLDGMDQQRLTYAVLRMLEDKTMYAGAIHNILRRVKRSATAKPPFYGRKEIHFTVDQLRRHYTHMRVLLEEMVPLALDIRATGGGQVDAPELYPNPHRDCSWRCPFLDVCPMMDDGGAWQWVLDEAFVERPPETMEIQPKERVL